MMTVNILAFGIAREIMGGTAATVQVADGATVRELKAALEVQYSALKQFSSFVIALNGEYAAPTAVVKANDEIAIIPPVSGG
jgi:molybdopterin synthase sulfur carrier subunit